MKLQRVFGNTYFIKGGTNTGVYLFENKNALLIDPGLSGLRPKNMINMFENEKIIPKYIVNTHEHEDHVGACHQIKNAYPEIAIFASDEAKLFIERPELFSDFILGGNHYEEYQKADIYIGAVFKGYEGRENQNRSGVSTIKRTMESKYDQ